MSASVRRSFVGCPAPLAAEVLGLARSFSGLGVVSVRPSVRSFSGWVCVCSFGSEAVASAFGRAAAARFFGPGSFVAVRRVGRRFRVSVPCLAPGSLVLALRPRSVRVGQFRVRVPGRGAAAVALAAELAAGSLGGLLRGVRSVGFSGSRAPSAAAVSALGRLLPLVPRVGCRVSVGCAAGVDEVVRSAFGGSRSLLVFEVARFASGVGFGRAAFAVRSARCVRSMAAGRRGLLVVVPSGACPSGVRPGRSFRGRGSGSWGSAALAAGLGRRVLVWLAAGVVPPAWAGFEWVGVGSGWWLLSRSSAVQLSLF